MAILYGSGTTRLCRKDGVFHLLFQVVDWCDAEYQFGEAVAEFRPFEKRWTTWDGLPLTQKELFGPINGGEVCMLGKDCPKHRTG
jgi:hypothetical protein